MLGVLVLQRVDRGRGGGEIDRGVLGLVECKNVYSIVQHGVFVHSIITGHH